MTYSTSYKYLVQKILYRDLTEWDFMKKSKYKFLYILVGTLLAINIVEFFIISSYSVQTRTESGSAENIASSENVVTGQFLLKDVEGCPNKIAGNPNAILKIKYFYNELCPYCRQEAPILSGLVSKRGDIFYIQMFDTDRCREDSVKAGVSRIPFFVFEANGESNSGGGFVKEEDLENFICRVTQGC